MNESLYTQLENFTRKFQKEAYRNLLKEKKLGEYLTKKSNLMQKELDSLLARGYREAEAMEFIRIKYFVIRNN